MERKYLIILIITILVFLVAFLFPRPCGNWGTAIGEETEYKDCTCFGIKIGAHPGIIGGDTINCWGIPTSYSCYKQVIVDIGTIQTDQFAFQKMQKINIPCE